MHLNEILNIGREKEKVQIDKMIFSLKCIKQLSDFKNNQRFRGNELLQATYMSIFSRYNDNRDRSKEDLGAELSEISRDGITSQVQSDLIAATEEKEIKKGLEQEK